MSSIVLLSMFNIRIMRILLIFIAFVVQTSVFGQDGQKIVYENELKGNQWKEWYALDTTWTENIMPVCMFENHVKLSCAECSKVYLTVQMVIDSAGKMIRYKKVNEIMCGKNFSENLEKCFLEFFKFIVFPADLRNIILEVKLGNGLKC